MKVGVVVIEGERGAHLSVAGGLGGGEVVDGEWDEVAFFVVGRSDACGGGTT